jgi:aurora kinase
MSFTLPLRRSADQFAFAKKLGGGYASTVHLAICKTTGIQVAIKVYHRCKLSQLNNYQVQREIRIHGALSHAYILELVSRLSCSPQITCHSNFRV